MSQHRGEIQGETVRYSEIQGETVRYSGIQGGHVPTITSVDYRDLELNSRTSCWELFLD